MAKKNTFEILGFRRGIHTLLTNMTLSRNYEAYEKNKQICIQNQIHNGKTNLEPL